MAITVNSAFTEFLANTVNLDPRISNRAKTSRDWLLEQIHSLPANNPSFPPLYSEMDMHFGSFARRTKIRELDDVDLLICLKACGTVYADTTDRLELIVLGGTPLSAFCHEGTNLLNSRRIINRFVTALADVPQYRRADRGRDGSAAVLDLLSYPWSFDIVPCFFTTPEDDGRTYYVIPDGEGYWMKTDPRTDRARVTAINQKNDGNVLNAVRIIKFWNRRAIMPTMESYLLECMILDYYDSMYNKATQFVDLEIGPLLSHIALAIFHAVNDPKNIQGDINNLSLDERLEISARAWADHHKASEARDAETAGDHRRSIRIWGEIFGPSFPSYG